MSHDYYTEIWLVTRSDLEKLLELERKLQDTPLRKEAALNSALSMYLKCVFKNIYIDYKSITSSCNKNVKYCDINITRCNKHQQFRLFTIHIY